MICFQVNQKTIAASAMLNTTPCDAIPSYDKFCGDTVVMLSFNPNMRHGKGTLSYHFGLPHDSIFNKNRFKIHKILNKF